MISQKCPRCYSKRIRRGYRPTSIISKLFFRFNLLCDSCNWEFKGFAVPGTVSSKPKKKRSEKVLPPVINKKVKKETSELDEKLLEFNKKMENKDSSNQ